MWRFKMNCWEVPYHFLRQCMSHCTSGSWFFLLRFYSKVIHIDFYYNVLFIWTISYWKIYKINARLNFQNSWQEKWCSKTSAMEYCTFIDNVHMYKNKDLCSNYGALRWRETKIFHSVYLSNDLFPPIT